MKRTFLLSLIALLSLSTIQAVEPAWQENPHSLSISAGAVSGFYLAKSLFSWIPVAAGHSQNVKYYGNYGLQYYYQTKRWCRVGVKGNWEGDFYDLYTAKKDDPKALKKGVTFDHAVSLVASAQFTYLNNEHVQLYSGLDAGAAAYIKDTRYEAGYDDGKGNSHPVQVTWLPAFNLTPIGVAFGSWRVFGYFETNIGYEAFAKIGLGVHI